MESQNLAEKVLEWLKKCGFGFVSTAETCGDCPYRESGCDDMLHEDAIKVIKTLMEVRSVKNPEEIVRCLRICKTGECVDQEGIRCSYEIGSEHIASMLSCKYSLLGDAADALAAAYNRKE